MTTWSEVPHVRPNLSGKPIYNPVRCWLFSHEYLTRYISIALTYEILGSEALTPVLMVVIVNTVVIPADNTNTLVCIVIQTEGVSQWESCEDIQAFSRNTSQNFLAQLVFQIGHFTPKSFAHFVHHTIMGVAKWDWDRWWLLLFVKMWSGNNFDHF